MPAETLLLEPSKNSVAVLFNGNEFRFNAGEPAELVDLNRDKFGQRWAKVLSFRHGTIVDGNFERTSGWILFEKIVNAPVFEKVAIYAGPRLVYAEAGDWVGSYYLAPNGVVFGGDGNGQLWRHKERYIATLPNSVESFEISSGAICLYGYCSQRLEESTHAGTNVPDEMTVQYVAAVSDEKMNEIAKANSSYSTFSSCSVRGGWQPEPGVYVCEYDFSRQKNGGRVFVLVDEFGISEVNVVKYKR